MVRIPKGVIRFHEDLEERIHLASLQCESRRQLMGKIPACKSSNGNLKNWSETCASGGYVELLKTRDRLYEIYPALKKKSETSDDHRLTYF